MIKEVLFDTIKIILIVTALMILVEYLQIKFKKKIENKITKNLKNQIIGSSLLGVIPGCFDAFFIVNLYSHGLVGFGALVAVMLSTAGDEAFVMLAIIPKIAFLIFIICATLGIVGGFISHVIYKKTRFKRAKPCKIKIHFKRGYKHFFKEHIYKHILKQHIPNLFIWIFFTLLIVKILMQNFDLASILPQNKLLLILIAALIGIIPESGPHLIFLTLYSQGLIPFSVLLVSSLSQDGHGLLPLLSYSVKDTIKVQIFTTLFSLGVGIILFFAGI